MFVLLINIALGDCSYSIGSKTGTMSSTYFDSGDHKGTGSQICKIYGSYVAHDSNVHTFQFSSTTYSWTVGWPGKFDCSISSWSSSGDKSNPQAHGMQVRNGRTYPFKHVTTDSYLYVTLKITDNGNVIPPAYTIPTVEDKCVNGNNIQYNCMPDPTPRPTPSASPSASPVATATPTPTNCFSMSGFFSKSVGFIESYDFTSSLVMSPSSFHSESIQFSKSNNFQETNRFSRSSMFEKTGLFSGTRVFSSSNQFSNSLRFTKTDYFSRTNTFSNSEHFSKSNNFSISLFFNATNSFSLSTKFNETRSFTKTKSFSESKLFTKSDDFKRTPDFTKSNLFTSSDQFSRSKSFKKTNDFTQSNYFAPSNDFTASAQFSETEMFSASKKKPTASMRQSTPEHATLNHLTTKNNILEHTSKESIKARTIQVVLSPSQNLNNIISDNIEDNQVIKGKETSLQRSNGLIIGLVIGILAVILIIIIIIIVFVIKKKQAINNSLSNDMTTESTGYETEETTFSFDSKTQDMSTFTNDNPLMVEDPYFGNIDHEEEIDFDLFTKEYILE